MYTIDYEGKWSKHLAETDVDCYPCSNYLMFSMGRGRGRGRGEEREGFRARDLWLRACILKTFEIIK